MQIAKKTLAIFLLTATLFLGGCWDSKELKNLDVVSAIALDSRAGMLDVTLEVLKPDKALEYFDPKAVKYLRGRGDSVVGAIDAVNLQGVKDLSLPHNRLLVLGETAATLSPEVYLDYFLRSYQVRPTMRLAIAADAGKLIRGKDEQEFTSGWQILNILDRNPNQETSPFVVTLQDFTNRILTTGIVPVLPVVDTVGDKPYIQRLAILKDNKVGYLTPDETQGYFWFTNQRGGSSASFVFGRKTMVLEVLDSKCSVKIAESHGKPIAKIKIKAWAGLKEESGLRGKSELSSADLNLALQKQIQAEVELAVAAAQGFNADFIGFGQKIYGQSPKLWQDVKTGDYLQDLEIQITVDTEIKFLGDTLKAPAV